MSQGVRNQSRTQRGWDFQAAWPFRIRTSTILLAATSFFYRMEDEFLKFHDPASVAAADFDSGMAERMEIS